MIPMIPKLGFKMFLSEVLTHYSMSWVVHNENALRMLFIQTKQTGYSTVLYTFINYHYGMRFIHFLGEDLRTPPPSHHLLDGPELFNDKDFVKISASVCEH